LQRHDLVRQHIIHDFDRAQVLENLGGCYGTSCRLFYEEMIKKLVGTRILDGGCGFGLFTDLCRKRGFRVHAIDIDEESLAIARSEYDLDCRQESIYETSLPANSIDTVVLNDVICHLDLDRLFAEVHRLGATRVIIHDSNTANPLLRLYRRLADHHENQDYTPKELLQRCRATSFEKTCISWVNFLCLPASGGLQRKPLPILGKFPRLLFNGDRLLQTALSWTGLQRFLAFRYLVVLDKRGRLKETA
jgi:SAM-dependent methyltransferase